MDNKFISICAFKPRIMRDDWKPIKSEVKKKQIKNARQAAVWLWRKVKNRIRRSISSKQILPVENRLWYWKKGEWEPMRKPPSEFMRGKRAVAPSRGHGGKERVKEVFDQGFRRWNKASRPGEGPISHPSDVPGWKDEWLHDNVFWEVRNGEIRIYVDKKNGGTHVKEILSALEFGGTTTKRRKWVIGYYVATIRSGYRAKEGTGKNSKSGKTRKTHKRKFRESHVGLTRRWESWEKTTRTEPRPFMAPVQDAFFRDYFPELYQNMGIVKK